MDQVEMMRIFIRAAESGSFGRAADQSHVSKAQVCRAVAWLEAHVQARLFTRTTRKISLTGAGLRYLEGSREFLERLDHLDRSVSGTSGNPGGTLSVVVTASLPPKTLIELLDGYRRRCPDVKVRVSTGENLMHVIDNRDDIALLGGSTRLPLGGEMEAFRLSFPAQRLLSCAAPAYIDRNVEPTDPDELSAHACVVVGENMSEPMWTFVDEKTNAHDVQITPTYSVNSAHHVRLAALAGIGIAVLPEWLAADDLANGTLKQILHRYTVRSSDTTMLLVYPRRRFPNQRLCAFRDNAISLAERVQRLPSPPGDTGLQHMQTPAVACSEQIE
ncbi:LysR family transcriptional regulator [Paraburkholderia terrae]